MSSDHFTLRWDEFENNAGSSFKSLLSDTTFTDVTLVSDDMKLIQAHTIILRSASQFFRTILYKQPNKHPILYLKGIQYSNLLALVDFIYLGETEVAQEDLNNFMEAATTLQVQGLLPRQNKYEGSKHPDPELPNHNHTYPGLSNDTKDGVGVVKFGNNTMEETVEQGLQPMHYPLPEQQLKSQHFDQFQDDNFRCDKCEYSSRYLNNLKIHKTSVHEGIRFECEVCGRSFTTKSNLQTHQYSKHEGRKYSCDQCNFEADHSTRLSQHKAKLHR